MKKMNRKPTHPGIIIKEDYLKPLSLTITELSVTIGVSRKTLSKIINERGSVTPDHVFCQLNELPEGAKTILKKLSIDRLHKVFDIQHVEKDAAIV